MTPARPSASSRPPVLGVRPPRPRPAPPSAPRYCDRCTKAACIILYSGIALCERHFVSNFDARVRRTVREFAMIRPHMKIGVAVSGGKDSLVMLRQLHALSRSLPMKLVAILVDEGIAGYREKTVPAARRECRKLKIALQVVSFKKEFGRSLDGMLGRRGGGKNPPGRPFGACGYCGVFRRALLNRAARRLKVDRLALGHNLDDVAQTVLMNLMRNEPARLARFGPGAGLAPHARMVPRIQPLFRCPEKEVALRAVLGKIPVCFGSCPHAHEAMRRQVREQLNEMEERYPGTKARIVNAFLAIQPALRAGTAANAPPFSACPACGDASSNGKCAACRMMDGMEKG